METLSRVVLTFALNAVWQVTLVAAVAAAGARLLRRAPARYLHVVWVTALALAAFLPLSSLPACWNSAAQPAGFAVIVENPQPAPAPTPTRALTAPLAPVPELSGVSRLGDLLRHRSRPIQLPAFLAYAALGFYLLSLLCHLARLAMAWRKTLRLQRAARLRDLPDGMASLAAQCRRALALENVPILCSSLAPGPATMGFRRPVIILPEALFQASPSDELTAALCHEMTHIRRHDYLVNLICEFIFLPVAFHPAAWLVKRRMEETRELACDEAAAGQLAGAPAYARSLLSLARAMSSLTSLPRPRYTLGVFDANILEERIMRLLEQRPRLCAWRAKLLMGGAALALALAGVGACAFSFTAQENAQSLTAQTPIPSVDISGRWELDKAKSDLPSPAPDNLVQVIEQRDPALKITSTSKDWNINKPIAVTLFALMMPELSITTDNRESVQPYGPGQMRSKSRWEHGKLITEWTLERDGQVMATGKWVRHLSQDGKAQTVEITAHDPNRNLDGEAKAVFVKTGESVARGFLGTWRGEFQGKTFLFVTLEKAGDALGGTVSIGGFGIDGSGQVSKVNEEPKMQDAVPIFGAKQDGSLLSFRCKPGGWPPNTPEGAPTDLQFQMRLTGDSVAELRGLGPPPLPGQQAPEWSGWWKLSRQSLGSNAEVRPGGPTGGVVGGVPGGVGNGVKGGVVGGVNGEARGNVVGVIRGIVGDVPGQEKGKPLTLSGTVSDPSGARVPNALVSLYGESGSKETAVTDDAGEFSYTGLAPGAYEWKVFRDGFEVSQQKLVISNSSLKDEGQGKMAVVVQGTASPRLDIVLAPSSTLQSMVVTAPAPPEVVEKRHAKAPTRIHVGGQVEAAKLEVRKSPVYPESARAKGVEGTVLLEAVISMEGVPLSLRVLESPDSELSDAALAAVRQWRYQPTLLNGQPIEVITTIAINFRLEG